MVKIKSLRREISVGLRGESSSPFGTGANVVLEVGYSYSKEADGENSDRALQVAFLKACESLDHDHRHFSPASSSETGLRDLVTVILANLENSHVSLDESIIYLKASAAGHSASLNWRDF